VRPGESDGPTDELLVKMIDIKLQNWSYLSERTWHPVRKRFEFPQRSDQRAAKLDQFSLVSSFQNDSFSYNLTYFRLLSFIGLST